METSLEFLKLLNKQGDLDDNLELVEKCFTDRETVENYELEDEGKGRAGTNKRKRAYEIKVWKLIICFNANTSSAIFVTSVYTIL